MNPISLPQVIAIISGLAAFVAVLAGAYKMGALTNRIDNTEKTVVEKLTDLADRFAAFQHYINDAALTRQEWAGWRSSMDERMESAESEHVRTSKNVHELRDNINAHGLLLAVIQDRRTGEADRRSA